MVWPKPEGEVMVYSIRLSYTNSTSGEMNYQFLTSTTNPWVTLLVMDLPSQRPLWIEVCSLPKFPYYDQGLCPLGSGVSRHDIESQNEYKFYIVQVQANNSGESAPWSSRVELCKDDGWWISYI